MNGPGKILVAGIAGLVLGWGGQSFFKQRPSPVATAPYPLAQSKRATERKPSDRGNLPDVDGCRELWKNSTQPDGRHPLLRRLDRARALRRWIELDPSGALAEAEQDPSADFAQELFQEWVELSPAAALAALNRANQTLAGALAKNFFLALMAKDPATAITEVKSARWLNKGERFLGWDFNEEVYRQWMRSDPAAAIASLGPPGNPDPVVGGQAMMEAWAEMDFKAAWAHYSSESPEDKIFEKQQAPTLLARGLLAGSPEALEMLGSIPESKTVFGRFVIDHQETIAESMVNDNPQAALAWADSRPADDLLRLRILAAAAGKIASSDPERALAMLKESGGSPAEWQNTDTLRQIFAAMAVDDPSGTAARVTDLPQEQRGGAMSGYLTRVFISDPASAVEQCRNWLDDPDLRNDLPQAWAKAFSWGDGAGVRDPAGMLAAIPELNDAVDENVLSTWTKTNPEAAAGWISERLEQGKSIPLGDEGILAELAISKPEFTASWLETLPNAAIQKTAAGTLAANWGAFDPVAARHWIDHLPAGELREAAENGLKRTKESRDFTSPR